jgi:hypothetical protein
MSRTLSAVRLIAIAVSLRASPCVAQLRPGDGVINPRPKTVPRDTTPPRTPASVSSRRTPTRQPDFTGFSVTSAVVSRVDNNVNRDSLGLTSVGASMGLGARFESAALRPGAVVEYDIALHRYTATTRFNRVSQRLRTTLSRRVMKRVSTDLVLEGALKGSSEDRDVSDQLTVLPRLDVRLTADDRLRVGAAQRWRRFPTDSLQDAHNQYVTAEVRHRLSAGTAVSIEARNERNDARGARFDFRRTAFTGALESSVARNVTFELEMQYRRQVYSGRFVKINRQDVPRRDHRLQPAAALHLHGAIADIDLSYEPEFRLSNDPRRSITQHVVSMGVRHRW